MNKIFMPVLPIEWFLYTWGAGTSGSNYSCYSLIPFRTLVLAK